MGTIQEIIDRAASEPDFIKRLVQNPLGTVTTEGYIIDMDELRELLDMPGADRDDVEDALQQRLAHSTSDRSIPSVLPPHGDG